MSNHTCHACLRPLQEPIAIPVCGECWEKITPDAKAIISSNWQLVCVIKEQGASQDGVTQLLRAAKAIESCARSMEEWRDLARIAKNRIWAAEGTDDDEDDDP